MRVCAIHQPNFFPWLGYFDKIRRADVFVFLDDVLFNKSGSGMGCWTNRVQVNIKNSPAWFGCPVRRESGEQIIRFVRIDDSQPWRRKLIKTLEFNYRKAPRFDEAIAVIRPLIEYSTDNLSELNIHAIETITRLMGLECRFVRQSELTAAGAGTELLISLIKAVGATTYLAGGGAAGYQQDDMIGSNGIELVYQNFVSAPYGDPSRFIPGLSVIDYLMHAGR